MNSRTNGFDKSWYGSVTLKPQNGGEVSSNSTDDYAAFPNNNVADLFDSTPEVTFDFETILIKQKAVQGVIEGFPKAASKWRCYFYHQAKELPFTTDGTAT